MAALLALLSSAMWGTADYVGGRLSRRWSALVVLAAVQSVGLLLMVTVATLAGTWGAAPDYLGPAAAAGIAGCAGLACYYQALSIGRMGVVAPIASLGVLVPIAVGLIGGDEISAAQLAGIVVAIVGVMLSSGPELSGEVGRTSVLLAVAAAFLLGIAQVGIAAGSETSVIMTMTAMRAAEVLCLAAIGLVLLGRRRARGRRDRGPVRTPLGAPADPDRAAALERAAAPRPTAAHLLAFAAAGVFDVGANLLFGVASTMGMLTLVAVFGSLYPVATILLARVLDGELLRTIQKAGVVLALGGAVVISAG